MPVESAASLAGRTSDSRTVTWRRPRASSSARSAFITFGLPCAQHAEGDSGGGVRGAGGADRRGQARRCARAKQLALGAACHADGAAARACWAPRQEGTAFWLAAVGSSPVARVCPARCPTTAPPPRLSLTCAALHAWPRARTARESAPGRTDHTCTAQRRRYRSGQAVPRSGSSATQGSSSSCSLLAGHQRA